MLGTRVRKWLGTSGKKMARDKGLEIDRDKANDNRGKGKIRGTWKGEK